MNPDSVDWPSARLCDVGVRLLDCDHKTPEPALTGYPYIAIPDIKDGRLDLSAVRRISRADYEEWTRKTKPQGGDIIVTRRGRVGDTAVIPPGLECAIGQNLVMLRSDGLRVDQSYLRWALQGPLHQRQVQKYLNVGAVFDSLNCRDIPKFEISVPPVAEQRAIAHVLGALDDKIELNRRMNETLESMARAIFKSWFIDFDPVRAKAEGRQPSGMDTGTAALFPDRFQASPLGPIPRGWRACALPEAIAVNPARSPANASVAPYLDMQNMPTRGHRPSAWVLRAFGSGMRFANGDTLLARITPCLENGKTALVDFLHEAEIGWGSTEYIVLRPLPPLPIEYAYYLARSDDFRAHAIQNMTGTSGRQRVPSSCFDQYLVVVPDSEVGRRFGEVAGALMAKISQNTNQNQTLAALRDALLPKLLSGEIRVRDAASVVEAQV